MQLHSHDTGSGYGIYDINGLKGLIRDELLDDDPKTSPLLIFGAPGIGKTAILRDSLDSLPDGKNWKLIIKTLSTETADNFFLPKYNQYEASTDVPKDWLPVYKITGDDEKDALENKKWGKGLLFIDELSRAIPQVLNVCLSLVHEHMFNGYKVASGWKIICASNRMEDEIEGQTEISNALSSRFAVAYSEPSPERWSQWASTQPHISPIFLQWIQMAENESMSGRKYFYFDPNDNSDSIYKIHTYCMPRSWDNAFRRLAKKHPKKSLMGFNLLEIPNETIKRTLNLHIPREAIDYFFSYIETLKVVGDFKQIYEAVWHKQSEINFKEKDLGKIMFPLIQFIISSHSDKMPTEEEFENFCDWVVHMDSDSLASYAFDIIYNVFGSEFSEGERPYIFLGAARYKELQAEGTDLARERMKIYDKSTKEWVKKWGAKNLGEMPDWSKGFDKLVKKYLKRFKNIQINGEDGLG